MKDHDLETYADLTAGMVLISGIPKDVVDRLRQCGDGVLSERYDELISAVGLRPGESRHETVLRYCREAREREKTGSPPLVLTGQGDQARADRDGGATWGVVGVFAMGVAFGLFWAAVAWLALNIDPRT